MSNQLTDIVSDALESDASFREQFNRESSNFHNGDPTPVPVGGERVPESMPTAYPDQPQPEDTPMHPDIPLVMEARNRLQTFKKALSEVCSAVEARLRASKFKDPEKRQAALADRSAKLGEVCGALNEYKESLGEFQNWVGDFSAVIDEIVAKAMIEYENKEQYGEYMLMVNRVSQGVFKQTKDLLQTIKELKKQ
mmetsp:Transcript_2553/g.4005  ORF Transcript_2553/g.4005 Transcript_2553/m.4005 type:complete len:195 (+) Transcript_2553:288-872(+)|eukprot:CAMPEP_0202439004 /NCGR_PEP_ID=MMETSP1345-20130828/35939_1 /ASSEMBLY_ACC=CAM_ASM_000843 /TAXON_ID=342563 /ORGANISM="Fabrea Fabrea salina" /LENGTH=194 /DNA_ID=CAMNT_0049053519 /DNA_START=218 /DNA_END=802 /DNA_ORIENTATION=+